MLKATFVGILPFLLGMPCIAQPPAPATCQAAKTMAESSAQAKARAAYTQGQEALARGAVASMKEAVKHYQEAARLDPDYAPAQVALAETCTTLYGLGILWRPETLARAKAAARKAVEIDPKLPAARTALGAVKMNEWDWAGAEADFRQALALAPESAPSRQWYAVFLTAMGRLKEALAQSTRANRLQPDSPAMMTGLGSILYFARDDERMIRVMERTVKLAPKSTAAYDWLGMAYVQAGRFDKSIEAYQRGLALAGGAAEVGAGRGDAYGVDILTGLGHTYGLAGRRAPARQVLRELLALDRRKHVPPVDLAFVYVGLGEKQRALAMLERAYRERSWQLAFIRVEPWLDPLRGDPRFQRLLRRLNFPPLPPGGE